MGNIPLILIAFKPGVLRDGLYAMAQGLPDIDRVEQVESAQDLLRHIEESPLRLVFLETALLQGAWAEVIRKIKKKQPEARCVVMVTDQNEFMLAEQAGADAVYISGKSINEQDRQMK
jgi:DNA-binding NarL/FixJ family response regulator